MNITIPDDIDGHERSNILEIYPIVYALKLNHFSIKKSAEFLNISIRGLRDKILRYPELKAFYNQRTDIDGINKYEADKIERDPLSKMCEFHLKKGMESFWYHQASQEERDRFVERVKKLYSTLK